MCAVFSQYPLPYQGRCTGRGCRQAHTETVAIATRSVTVSVFRAHSYAAPWLALPQWRQDKVDQSHLQRSKLATPLVVGRRQMGDMHDVPAGKSALSPRLVKVMNVGGEIDHAHAKEKRKKAPAVTHANYVMSRATALALVPMLLPEKCVLLWWRRRQDDQETHRVVSKLICGNIIQQH